MPLDGSLSNDAFADAAGLSYVNDEDPGIRRRRFGKGFSYYAPDGSPVKDMETIDRIRKLAIPPAWTQVWISPDPNGHIQATGRDDRGRKQYRYHDKWRTVRDETKYARMAAFGRALPKIRERVDADLRRRGFPKEKVVAAVVRLLERTMIRVGNEEYAKENKHFGLTTLTNRHVHFHGAEIEFEFRGKSGVKHKTGLHDRRLARVVKSIQELRGQRLFQYVDEDGQRHPIESHDVNAYLHEITGEHFTAKDFRTWAGTIAAAKALAMQPPPENAREATRTVTLCVKATAGLLGNTPAVCRAAYIHPGVLTAFAERKLPEAFAHAEGDEYEQAVLDFLDALADEVSEQTGVSKPAQVAASQP